MLREAFRLNRYRLNGAYHLALVARKECPGASLAEIETELLTLMRRLGCLQQDEPA
jgi:RNase P protein component